MKTRPWQAAMATFTGGNTIAAIACNETGSSTRLHLEPTTNLCLSINAI